MAQKSIQFGLQNAGAVNQANMAQLQDLLNQALPGYQGMVGQMSGNVRSLLAGAVPQDVQDQIQRSTAYQNLISGIGGPGGAGGALTRNAATARSLGLTSLSLQQMGAQQGTNLMQLARNYLMPQPVNPLSLLPLSDLIQGGEWQREAQFQANLAGYTASSNQAAAAAGQPLSNPLAGIGGGIGAITSTLGQTNPNTGQSNMQGLLGLLGLGGGSSGLGGTTDITGTGVFGGGASGDPFGAGGSFAF